MGGLIHVGAWEGLEFANERRTLLLFEPQARAFEALKRNLSGNPHAVLVNAAAGATPGEMTMHKVAPDHSSSLLEPAHLREGFHFDGEETVRVTTVDLVVEEFGLAGLFDVLAVDTQGYELEVLKGAQRTLPDIVRVECELHDANTYPGAASLETLDEFLADRGFGRTALDRQNSDDWGDAIYERRV